MKMPICFELSLLLGVSLSAGLVSAQTPALVQGTAGAASTQSSAPASTPAAAGSANVPAPEGDAALHNEVTNANSAVANPAGVNSAVANPTGANSSDATTDQDQRKRRADQRRNDSEAKSDEAKSDEAKSDEAKSGEAKSGEAKSDEAKSDEAKSEKLPWDAKPKIKIGGLLHSQFAINDAEGSANSEFRLANARISLEWQQGYLLDAVAEVELSRDGDRESTAWAPMRDAYVRVSPDRALRLRLGQFKRPFGKLALTPLRDLKLIRRGISDVWINEELHYGERDVGFQVDGQLGHGYELHYAVGVFNGSGRNHREGDPNGVKDFVARVEGRLGKHFSIGVDTANKRFDRDAYPGRPKSVWASGADVLVEIAGLYGLVEAQYGSNFEAADDSHTGSLLALVAYKIPVAQAWRIAVEPLVKGEILKVETELSNRHILNGTAGANLYVGKIFRLMVQGEWIQPKGPLPDNLGEAKAEKRLIIQAGMYTR